MKSKLPSPGQAYRMRPKSTLGLSCLLVTTRCSSLSPSRDATVTPTNHATTDPARVILFRHGEKPGDESNPHLLERWLATCARLGYRCEQPSGAIARHPTNHRSRPRPIKTLRSRVAPPNMVIQTLFTATQMDQLAREERRNYAGQTVVICWVHEFLPDLARALGATATVQVWTGKDLVQVWIIEYSAARAGLQVAPPLATTRPLTPAP